MSIDNKIKVIYIIGAGRSGSTIVCNLIGQIKHFFSCGELYHLFSSPSYKRYCGCGKLVSKCEVWYNILNNAFGKEYEKYLSKALVIRNRIARSRYIIFWLLKVFNKNVIKEYYEFTNILLKLYKSIIDNTGAKVIIDSSKIPTYGYLLKNIPEIEVYFLHLVRDARGVVYSWQRKVKKQSPEDRDYLPTASLLHATFKWIGYNIATELLTNITSKKHLRIQYEKFIASPYETLMLISKFVNEPEVLPVFYDNMILLEKHHTVGGNPDRFRTGPVALVPDNEWQSKMRPLDRALVTLLTWPLLLRYGYRL